MSIERDKGIDLVVIRFPAQEDSGSPDVVNRVWKQISDCDLFIGDLTAITEINNQSISNSNVMYEVGIADALLGEKRVILICSNKTNISKLAFDVNHKRISHLDEKNQQKSMNQLCNWIEAGIVECDIQQLQRDFIFKDIYSDLFVVYNNFMRMVYRNDYMYTEGVIPPDKDTIIKKLTHTIFNELMISVDYNCVVERLKREIRSLYDSNNRRYLTEIINIYKSLDKYNCFLQSIDKNVVFSETDIFEDVLIYNADLLKVVEIDIITDFYGSVLFNNEYIYLSGEQPFHNVYLKEMITKQIKEKCNYQKALVDMENGYLYGLKMHTYSLIDGAESIIGEYIYDIIFAIYDFMDKMNFEPLNTNTDIKSNSIIIWEKTC